MAWFAIVYLTATLIVWAWLRSVPRPNHREDWQMEWIGQRRVVSMTRGGQTYIYVFNVSQRRDVLGTLGRQAVDPELSLTWSDALILERCVRKVCQRRF